MRRFVTYEHHKLLIGQPSIDGEYKFKEEDRQLLENFYGEDGVSFFSLIHNGVKFCEHVGVLQIGNLVIEVLPKADNKEEHKNDKEKWRNMLIDMLRAVGTFKIHAPSSSALEIKHNHILDLYIEIFIGQVESLLHKGLVKKYRKEERNSLSLKGSLQFAKHIQQNLVHQERFYVRQTSYDKDHLLHQILYKTIRLLKRINSNEALNSRIGSLLLNFPEMNDLKVTEATFKKISYNRKTEPYRDAIEVARMLLLNYHPDLKGGQDNVLALLFNMNNLWEAFVYQSLLNYAPKGVEVTPQNSKDFWVKTLKNGERDKNASPVGMRADILIRDKRNNQKQNFVLDTKWKNIGSDNPSPDDLRQLYVYSLYYGADKVALVYPGDGERNDGKYYREDIEKEELSERMCSVIKISVEANIEKWQKSIACVVYEKWMNLEQPTSKE